MEGSSTHAPANGLGIGAISNSSSKEQMPESHTYGVYYVWHCNRSVGAIFTGSQTQCRAFMLANPTLFNSSIICSEDEHIKFTQMPEDVIRAYFDDLKLMALKGIIENDDLDMHKGDQERIQMRDEGFGSMLI